MESAPHCRKCPREADFTSLDETSARRRAPISRDWYLAELKKLLTAEPVGILDQMLAANERVPLLPHLGLGESGGRR
jgi:hypothetical protein